MGTVLFTSVRPLERAENLKAVYDAYDGDKEYVQSNKGPIDWSKYVLQVGDELPGKTPGKFIFIGHGMGAGKLYGLDRPCLGYRDPDLITYAIASSDAMIHYVARFTGCDKSKIIPLGMPRTDAYFRMEKVDTPYKQYLYAPTFRNGGWQPYWSKLDLLMPDDIRIIAKPHMVSPAFDIGFREHITEVSNKETSANYLVQTDGIISDYSSIMFDAMVLRKPIILFARDKNRYLMERGMYCQYPEMYSKYFCQDEERLVELMRSAEWDDYSENLRQYYAGACDGNSTQRVIDLIRSLV